MTGTRWRMEQNAGEYPDQLASHRFKKFVIPVKSRAEVKIDMVGPRKFTEGLYIDKKIKHLKFGGKLPTEGFQAGGISHE